MDQHPSDYLLYRLVASAHAARGREGAGEALALVNRALYLAPLDASSHRVAARALLALGRSAQGFLEYRLAHEAGDATVLLGEALPQAETLASLMVLTPQSPATAVRLLDALANTPGRLALALDYSGWAREHFAGQPEAAALWAREARLRILRGDLETAEAARAQVERRRRTRWTRTCCARTCCGRRGSGRRPCVRWSSCWRAFRATWRCPSSWRRSNWTRG
ncbi:hypothetical protein QEG98_06065 [Myxococcus sp. MxC21-1]|uniref:hypothetical protein n=1 Tax=Myxococcus sp. MxC21-1 TaxID=3041439 RepID=UPI00292ECC4B|nr:hypothetical protein [Myxococcus sp. MxC21-1]WNZ63315.1 hypothetical protein QEG98_06065 [Myxococcus sp. MxC21-1]